jgi:hypothetical protein
VVRAVDLHKDLLASLEKMIELACDSEHKIGIHEEQKRIGNAIAVIDRVEGNV